MDADSWKRLPDTLRISLDLLVPNRLGGIPKEIAVSFQTDSPRDLEAPRLLERVEPLASLAPLVDRLGQLSRNKMNTEEIQRVLSPHVHWDAVRRALDSLLRKTTAPTAVAPVGGDQDPSLDRILDLVEIPGSGSSPPLETSTGPQEVLTTALFEQLESVAGEARLRRVQANWMGVRLLLQQIGTEGGNELLLMQPDPDRWVETLGTALHGLPHTGQPDLIVTDFVLNGSATELATLRELGELGAAFQVPVCFSVTPRFLGLDEAAQADTVEYLGTRFDGATYDGWRALREKEVSRWLVAAFNPVLGREPYRVRLGDTAWEERFPRDGDRPWMDPAWAVAGLAARSSARMEWATEITLGSGAELAGFPVRPHPAGTGAGATQIPLGAALTDQAARDLAKQGIAALACRPNRDGVFLVRAPVVRSPSRYGVTAADAASRRMATLPYQFLAARVARVVEEQLEREDLAQADVAPALHLALRSLVANTGQGSHVEVNTTSGEEGHRLRVTTRTGNAVLGGAEVVLEVPLDSR